MTINQPAPGRLPLHPGRPLVFRCRRRGVWGYACNCLQHSRLGNTLSSEEPNRDNWADAMRAAHDHITYWHKTATHLEVERLEYLYGAPAYAGRAA